MIVGYHGTNARFSKFDQRHARIFNDFYGGGVAYFTDNVKVAVTYAKSMSKKGGSPIVYEAHLNLRKVFDVDHKFIASELTKFYTKKTLEDFARGAKLLRPDVDKYTLLGRLETGSLELTGDQVFRGLSQGMVHTAKAREKLVELGYDGLRYNGGLNMEMMTRHNVYLIYNAEDAQIVKTYAVQEKQQNKMVAEQTLKGYIKKHTNEVRTLNVWDIDDTLFKTDARVAVKLHGNHVRHLEPGEYNTYKRKPGEEYDFSEFRDGKLFRASAKPISNVLDRAKSIIMNQSENSDSIILTARSDFNDHKEFLQAFRDHGFPIDHVYVERSGNLSALKPDAKMHTLKAVVLKKYVNSGKYDRVRIWDDSKANLDMLLKLAKPDVEVIAYHVDHSGKVTRYGSNGSHNKKQVAESMKNVIKKTIHDSIYD